MFKRALVLAFLFVFVLMVADVDAGWRRRCRRSCRKSCKPCYSKVYKKHHHQPVCTSEPCKPKRCVGGKCK